MRDGTAKYEKIEKKVEKLYSMILQKDLFEEDSRKKKNSKRIWGFQS